MNALPNAYAQMAGLENGRPSPAIVFRKCDAGPNRTTFSEKGSYKKMVSDGAATFLTIKWGYAEDPKTKKTDREMIEIQLCSLSRRN